MIVEEWQDKIGTEGDPVTIVIEGGLLGRFVQAVGDSNPLWQDEGYARGGKTGGMLAPPYLLCALMTMSSPSHEPNLIPVPIPKLPLPGAHTLDGGGEWEFFLPLKRGDTLISRTRLADVFERQGKMGTMGFFVYQTTYTNQRDEVIAKVSSTFINY